MLNAHAVCILPAFAMYTIVQFVQLIFIVYYPNRWNSSLVIYIELHVYIWSVPLRSPSPTFVPTFFRRHISKALHSSEPIITYEYAYRTIGCWSKYAWHSIIDSLNRCKAFNIYQCSKHDCASSIFRLVRETVFFVTFVVVAVGIIDAYTLHINFELAHLLLHYTHRPLILEIPNSINKSNDIYNSVENANLPLVHRFRMCHNFKLKWHVEGRFFSVLSFRSSSFFPA